MVVASKCLLSARFPCKLGLKLISSLEGTELLDHQSPAAILSVEKEDTVEDDQSSC